MNSTKKPLILVGAILLALSGLASFDNLKILPSRLRWLTSPDNSLVPLTILDLISMLAVTLGSLGLAIWAFIAKNPKTLRVPALAVLSAGPVLAIGIDCYWFIQGNNFLVSFFQTYSWATRIAAAAAVFPSLVGAGLVALGAFTAKPLTQAAPTANRFDPTTGEPIQQPVAAAPGTIAQDGLPVSNLPQLAFILGILTPLIGVILGAVSLNQMKLGQISRVNEKQARNGILIGSILMGVSFVFSIILIVVSVILAAKAYNPYSY